MIVFYLINAKSKNSIEINTNYLNSKIIYLSNKITNDKLLLEKNNITMIKPEKLNDTVLKNYHLIWVDEEILKDVKLDMKKSILETYEQGNRVIIRISQWNKNDVKKYFGLDIDDVKEKLKEDLKLLDINL